MGQTVNYSRGVSKVGARRGKVSNLRSFSLNFLQDRAIGGLAESTVQTGLLIIRKSGRESLRAVVESVTKWLMNALNGVVLSHKYALECRGTRSRMSSHENWLV